MAGMRDELFHEYFGIRLERGMGDGEATQKFDKRTF
jgi:hypothetical protein